MGVTCALKSCSSTRSRPEEGVTFFRFPSDPAMRSKWYSLCGLNPDLGPSNPHLCSKHFTKDDVIVRAKKSMLKTTAIPQVKKKTIIIPIPATPPPLWFPGAQRHLVVPGNQTKRPTSLAVALRPGVKPCVVSDLPLRALLPPAPGRSLSPPPLAPVAGIGRPPGPEKKNAPSLSILAPAKPKVPFTLLGKLSRREHETSYGDSASQQEKIRQLERDLQKEVAERAVQQERLRLVQESNNTKSADFIGLNKKCCELERVLQKEKASKEMILRDGVILLKENGEFRNANRQKDLKIDRLERDAEVQSKQQLEMRQENNKFIIELTEKNARVETLEKRLITYNKKIKALRQQVRRLHNRINKLHCPREGWAAAYRD